MQIINILMKVMWVLEMDRAIIDSYLEKNPFIKLSEIVADVIYDEIIGLNIPPSSKLNINQIANELGVSRTPVVEAMVALQEIGFVETRPNINGFYVTDMNLRDLLELYSARSAIECEAAALCAENASPENIEQLEALATAFQKAIPMRDSQALHETDLPFHQLIIESCGNKYLIRSYNELLPNLRMYQRSWTKFISPEKNNPWASKVLHQHLAIVSCIKMHIPSLAKQSMEEHIKSSINFVAYSETADDPFSIFKKKEFREASSATAGGIVKMRNR